MEPKKKKVYEPQQPHCVCSQSRTLLTISLLTAFLVFASANQVLADTYYVANPNGADDIAGTADDVNSSDSYTGTENQPWSTIGRAMPNWGGAGPVVSQGDTVYVASGDYGKITYSENQDTGRSNWITYIGTGATKPILRHLGISYTPNAYMKFDNFAIYKPVSGVPARSIEILGQNVSTNRASNIGFDNCYIEMATALPLGYPVWLRYADDITFNNCEIVGGSKGLLASIHNTNLAFLNCHFHDQWGDSFAVFSNETESPTIWIICK